MPDKKDLLALHQGNGHDGQATAVQTELPLGSRLSRQQFEAYLWSAADILRGSIDSSDYENYIFGLLFLKRLSDVFEEEAEKLIAEGLPAEVAWTDPDEHQLFVAERARWRQIQRIATNPGEVLNTACMALEEANSALEGVLAPASTSTTSAVSAMPGTVTRYCCAWCSISPDCRRATATSPSWTCSGVPTST